jgi:hypothetical protein
MKAVYETEFGSVCMDGVSSDVHIGVHEVLKRATDYDVLQIWIVEDEAPSDASAYVFTVPDWKLESVHIIRTDGEVAKVWLGIFSDEAAWDAFEREFSGASVLIEPGDFDADGDSYRGWDRLFFWDEDGDNVSLAEWYVEGQRCPVRLPPAIHATSCPANASRTSTSLPARRRNTCARTRPTSSYG